MLRRLPIHVKWAALGARRRGFDPKMTIIMDDRPPPSSNAKGHAMLYDRQFLDRLGVDLPIIQAPMAGVSTPAMAAAVSNAGGLGSIGVGATDAETARQMIRAVRTASDRPFNVNVFCHRPAVRDSTREAAWLSRLSPIFSQYGAAPPSGLREIYTSFVEDDAMLAMLLEE